MNKPVSLSSLSRPNDDPNDPRNRIVILVGDTTSFGPGQIISDYLRDRFCDRYRASLLFSYNADHILAVANSINVDVFILVLNNIIHGYLYGNARINASVELSALIKKSGRSVIALSSIRDSAYTKSAILASNYYFTLPSYLVHIGDALEKCLEAKHDDYFTGGVQAEAESL